MLRITTYFGAMLFAALVFGSALSGCMGPRELPAEVVQEIQPGATAIIIERSDPNEQIGNEALAFELFDDAMTYFAANGFQIDGSNEETLTFTTEPTQIEDGLALRIDGAVEIANGGSRLIVAAQHAPTIGTPPGQWEDAAWTTPEAKRAFEAAFTLTQEIPHTDAGTAVE